MGTLKNYPLHPGQISRYHDIAKAFKTEDGWSLEELEQRTIFIGDDLGIKYGTKDHALLWSYRKAVLLAETAALVQAILTASPAAYAAAGHYLGIDLPLRPGEHRNVI